MFKAMTAVSNNKKQKTILDFFRRTNVDQLGSFSNNNTDVNIKRESLCDKVFNDCSNKRPLENTETSNLVEDNSLIDINYIDENLFLFSFEETIQETLNLGDDNVEITKVVNSSDYVYKTFRSIIKTVLIDPHHEYLFNENDWNQIQDFTSLAGPVQVLFIKLYMRKHNWIRITNIKYPELNSECNHIFELNTLLQHGFLIDSSDFGSIEEGFSALTFPEIKIFLKKYNGFKLPKNTLKNKIIQSFIDYIKTTKSVCSSQISIENDVLKRLKSFCTKKCVKINEQKSKLFDRIILLYYSPSYLLEKIEDQNEDQWYRCILGDYSISDENYPIPISTTNKVTTLYTSREELTEFSEAFSTLCEILGILNQKQWTKVIEKYLPEVFIKYSRCINEFSEKDLELEDFLRQFTATGMYVSVLHECLFALDKARMYSEYINLVQQLLSQYIYGTRYRPHWYMRASLISQCYLKNFELTEQLCLDGLKDYSVKHDHRIDLYSRLSKLKKSTSIPFDYCSEYYKIRIYNKKTIYADYRHIENETDRKNFFFYTHENGDEEMISVEEVVIRHYKALGYQDGIHCESTIYHILFGLLFWDIIYSLDFPDSFRYHKQIVPIDLCFESFYQRRKDHIDQRVLHIENFTEDELQFELTNTWNKNHNKASLLINWNYITLQKLIEIALCLSCQKLAKILHILAQNFRHLRKGFPDLIVWDVKSKRIKMIEVKGPLDRITYIQSIWLSYLNSLHIDAELCHVKPKSR